MRRTRRLAACLILVAVPAMAAAPSAVVAKPGALHYVWSVVQKLGAKVEGPAIRTPEGGGGRPCLSCHVIVGTGI